jgi:hypothetical protein
VHGAVSVGIQALSPVAGALSQTLPVQIGVSRLNPVVQVF